MFNFFKTRREKAQRKAVLEEYGQILGDGLRAELNLFLELKIVPVRHAYMEVLTGLLATLDERMSDMIAASELTEGDVDREEAAALEVRTMMDNWEGHEAERLEDAHIFLREQFDIAKEAGVADYYETAVGEALNEQRLILLTDGMGAVNSFMGR